MKAKEISKYLDKLAPRSLAYEGEEFGFIYGNEDKDIKKIAVAWRPTVELLEEAAEKKIDLLIIHEPLFHSEKSAIIPKEELKFTPNKERRNIIEEYDMLIYRYHSQWDDAEKGNNETLVELFDMKNIKVIPFGRIGNITKTTLGDFTETVKEKLECTNVLRTSDDKEKEINWVAVISGSGNSLIEMIEHVKNQGADVLVSGDIADGRARYAKEIDLPIIDVGGYYSERPGMKNLTRLLSERFPEAETIFLDTGKPWDVI